MLDSMCVLVGDGTKYSYYDDLVTAMAVGDETLVESSNY